MLKRPLLQLLVLLAVMILAPAATSLAAPPTAEDLAAAIEQLGHARFDQRRQATDLLWASGEAARPYLESATTSKNAEVRARARAILEQFKFGQGIVNGCREPSEGPPVL